MRIVSGQLNVVCDCGHHFVALFRPPDWQEYCPKCAGLYRLNLQTVKLEKVA